MEEIERKKSQSDLQTAIKFIRAKDSEIQISKENADKYKPDYRSAYE